jgi:hypothetical protein
VTEAPIRGHALDTVGVDPFAEEATSAPCTVSACINGRAHRRTYIQAVIP